MAEIYVGPGYVAHVDLSDLPLVSPFRWTASHTRPGVTYARTLIDGHTVYMHQLILGKRDGLLPDHRDGNGLNNVRTNLRWATHSQNAANRQPQGAVTTKGVRRCRNKWRAEARVNGRKYHLGMFTTQEGAVEAYNNFVAKAHGEFAVLNVLPAPVGADSGAS